MERGRGQRKDSGARGSVRMVAALSRFFKDRTMPRRKNTRAPNIQLIAALLSCDNCDRQEAGGLPNLLKDINGTRAWLISKEGKPFKPEDYTALFNEEGDVMSVEGLTVLCSKCDRELRKGCCILCYGEFNKKSLKDNTCPKCLKRFHARTSKRESRTEAPSTTADSSLPDKPRYTKK